MPRKEVQQLWRLKDCAEVARHTAGAFEPFPKLQPCGPSPPQKPQEVQEPNRTQATQLIAICLQLAGLPCAVNAGIVVGGSVLRTKDKLSSYQVPAGAGQSVHRHASSNLQSTKCAKCTTEINALKAQRQLKGAKSPWTWPMQPCISSPQKDMDPCLLQLRLVTLLCRCPALFSVWDYAVRCCELHQAGMAAPGDETLVEMQKCQEWTWPASPF